MEVTDQEWLYRGHLKALQDVRALAEKWRDAKSLSDGKPNIVAQAFADELFRALNGF